ncbi:lysine N(6)-hydroxylase/L-ornithine N(5)-oxygenase family protein [Streptomyces rubiginosohelvolus]|uniref:lysine N(6)-hydroxylase/L-ornithine N(5)-oxygenase family protein n=1 Tax=Streptomyces rubiginosohelvolus TaxID=67362 RepID=UPI0037A3AF3B
MTPADDTPLDLLGVGIGPFNLSLAALADGVPRLRTAFLDQRPRFHWHPGLLIEGSTLQVPFLADLVSMVDPTSQWSFLNHLRAEGRLFPFYFAERFHVLRTEFDAYCRWVTEELPSCRFGRRVDEVRWDAGREAFAVTVTPVDESGTPSADSHRLHARHVALGVGTVPRVPEQLRRFVDDPRMPVWHSSAYLEHRDDIVNRRHVTVVGSGQSGAEVFLDLLRHRPHGREGLSWVARTPAFAPMEYSKLGLEQFTPDYTKYFRGLKEPVCDRLLPDQWQLYKAISGETLGEIHDELYRRTVDGGWPDVRLTPGVHVGAAREDAFRIELSLSHAQQGTDATLHTDAVVVATGYNERPLGPVIGPLEPHMSLDASGRPEIDGAHRLVLDGRVGGSVFVQNAERHSHGVGTPDLGLAAWRSAVIVNSISEKVYSLPERTAFTTFGLGDPAFTPGTGRSTRTTTLHSS